jgi:peptidoglycan hydrolase-like protein with peptidoglycan-binding domain
MKKLLILSLITACAFSVMSVQAQQGEIINNFATHQCPVVNLTVGSRGAEVTKLQQILVSQGLLNVAPTGYFGVLTKRAVATYQAKNGITPAVGYFGPITRGYMLAADVCGTNPTTPQPANGVTITAPAGDVTWAKYYSQKISWIDSKTYIQAPKYDIKIQSDTCEPGKPCILLYPLPITIASNVNDTQFNWSVGYKSGEAFPASPSIPDGKYRIYVCPTGLASEDLNGCAKSAGRVTIRLEATPASGTSTPISFGASVAKRFNLDTEKFDITITAKNNLASAQKLGFTSSCQVSYKIENVYHYMAARLCAQALTEVTLQPGETKVWTLSHDPNEFKLPVGNHTIVAEVMGHGSATFPVTITKADI